MALPNQSIAMGYLEEETAATLNGSKRFVMFDEDKSRSASLEDIKEHILGDINSTVEEQSRNIQAINSQMGDFVQDLEVDSEGLVYLLNNGERIAGPYGPFAGGGGGGGGGGSSNNAIFTLMNTSGWISKTTAEGASCPLSFMWSSTEEDIATGDGILVVRINGATRINKSIPQGATTIDIKDYLSAGTNSIRVTVSDVYSNTRSIAYTVSVISLSIRSSFDATTPKTGTFTFNYTPVGQVEKIVYFIIDGNEYGTYETSYSGRQLGYEISGLSYGAHSLLVYFESEVNGDIIRSNELYYEITYVDSSSVSPIITSTFRETTAQQYTTLQIPYAVYSPNSQNSNVELYVNGNLWRTLSIDRTEHIWSYRVDTIGPLVLKIQTGSVYKEFNLTITPSAVVAKVTTENMVLSLQSAGRSNSEEHPELWTYTNPATGNIIRCTLNGFNYTSDGWVSDGKGGTVLRVGGTATVDIPYQPFANDARSTGKTIEIDFATKDVVDYDAVILSCMNGNRGIELTSQKATFKSASSTISTQYKEEDHIRLTFVVEKSADGHRLLMIYVNGIPSGVVQYPATDSFTQTNPANITIGAVGCTMDIYSIRIYDNNLTRNQVLDNWIADEQNVELMLERYLHNDVYDAYGKIVISKLPADLPYMILEGPILPQYKGHKLRVNGSFVDPANPSNSFTFTNCQINVQGTSSAPYARKNYDLQFKDNGFEMSDGTHADNYALHPSVIPFNRFVLKADVASSEGANNVELVKLFNDINPFKSKEQLANDKVRQGIYGFPIVVFWSNTETNTTTFLGKYNFNLPKRAPGPYGYSGDMESWEFQNNTSNLMLFKSDYFSMAPVQDTDGNSKEAWRYDYEARFPSDEWTNIDKLQELQSFIYSTYRENATGNTLSSSVTYTETHTVYDQVTDPNTGAIDYIERLVTEDVTYTTDTAAYRLARFKNEFSKYADVNSFIFYYIFTELFLMVDSRAKNLFIGFNGSDATGLLHIDRKAVAQPYDMDTAIGTNNEGSLVFGYGLEDTDYLEGGANIFNGQDSVLWCNLRDAFPSEIATMYQTLRSNGVLSFNTVEQRFEDHQKKWPEAVWIEDAWFKYIDPLISPDPGKDPTDAYLPMMQGSKEEQRKWWLLNRFRYMDSKWMAGDAISQEIQLRGYAKANITVIPHTDIYPSIKYGSYIVQKRGQRNQATVLECPIDTLNDTEIYIYSAPQLASVGDLSGLKVGFADFSKAIRLQNIKLGDASNSYRNENLNSVTFGNNKLLQTVDVRNCTALGTGQTTILDLQNCSLIENVYCEGTQLQGVSLPNGGILKILHLPATTTNLIIRNQPLLTQANLVVASYSNISKLVLENVPQINIQTILNSVPANTRIYLKGFTWNASSIADIDNIFAKFDTMLGCDATGQQDFAKAQVQGTIVFNGTLTGAQAASYYNRYSDVIIEARELSCTVTYLTASGDIAYVDTVTNGGHSSYGGHPSKSSTAQYSFTWAGWSESNDNIVDPNAQKFITRDKTLYPCYTSEIRTYTIKFVSSSVDGGQTWETQTLAYGEIPVYGGATPVKAGDEETHAWPFYGWTPDITLVTGDKTYTAIFRDTSPITRILVNRGLLDASGTNSYIGSYAFGYCSVLKAISFPNVSYISDSAFYSCQSLTTISLPNITSIGTYAFGYCRSLSMASFPNVSYLGESAFQNCDNLTIINFPQLSIIPSYAFQYCGDISSINLPNVTSIGYYAFGGCSFSSIKMSNVTYLSGYAFHYCRSLKTIDFPDVVSIGYDVFGWCSRLSSVKLPNVVSISGEAFSYCTDLMNINLPKVQTIGQSVFSNCSHLTTVSFPAISRISAYAFVNCYSLKNVYFRGSSVPVLENINAFENTPLSNTYQGTPGSIYVPASLVADYQRTNNWKAYSSRITSYIE